MRQLGAKREGLKQVISLEVIKTFLLTEVSDSETPSALQRVNPQREFIMFQTTIKGSSLAVDSGAGWRALDLSCSVSP